MAEKEEEEISSEELRGLQEGILWQSSINHLQCRMLVSVETGEGKTRSVLKGPTSETLRDLRGDVQTEDSIPSILWQKMLGIKPSQTCRDRPMSALWERVHQDQLPPEILHP